MLRKGIKTTYTNYEQVFKARLTGYGECDVFRFEYAVDKFNQLTTEGHWLIINDTHIVSYGSIPRGIEEEFRIIKEIFYALKKHKDLGTKDIVKKVFEYHFNKNLDRQKVHNYILMLLNEGYLERGPHTTVRIPGWDHES